MENLEEKLDFLRRYCFLAPDTSNSEELVKIFSEVIRVITTEKSNRPIYGSVKREKCKDHFLTTNEIPEEINKNIIQLLSTLPNSLQGAVKSYHPFLVKNIIPSPAFLYIAVQAGVSLLMANGVTGEDSGEILQAELDAANAFSKLAGYDEKNSAGIFTFGGTATNLYAFKIGINKVCRDAMIDVIDKNLCVVGSWPAHYSHQTACAWLGLGIKNYIRVKSQPNQSTDLDSLEKTCIKLLSSGKRIACIVGAGGTTSNLGIDDFEKISAIRDRITEKFNLDYKIHIHADTVLGWVYLNFKKYDFEENPLQFSKNIVSKLKKALKAISSISYADSFGIDFHKTGYMPYISSMFIVKNKKDFELLRREEKIMTPLFHDANAYNPGKFTLETSRSSASILAAWVTAQQLGMNGYRVLIGNSLECAEAIRVELAKNIDLGLLVVNSDSFGPDLFLRCYSISNKLSPQESYLKELNNEAFTKNNNSYNKEFFNWLISKSTVEKYNIVLSKTSAAHYTPDGRPIEALRIYILNPFMNNSLAKELVRNLVSAKKDFDSNVWCENNEYLQYTA